METFDSPGMSIKTFKRSQTVPLAPQVAWSFFVNPHNLLRITPPALGLEIFSETPGEVYSGQLISYTVRPFLNIPIQWTSEIRHLSPPRYFVDDQRLGPYRFWYHQHFFTPQGDSSTLIEDIVSYQLPLGRVGRLFAGFLVDRKLNEIFDYREQKLAEITSGSL